MSQYRSTHLMSTEALTQRRRELVAARRRLDVELERITTALMSRKPRYRRPPPEHGTQRKWRAGCRCVPCRAWKANETRTYRERKKEIEMNTPTKYPRIPRPKVDINPGPGGMVFATCRHCDFNEGPSVKTYMQERAMAHRADHRAGRIEATR